MPRKTQPTQRAKAQPSAPTQAQLLAKIPRKPLTPEQQRAALDKVQTQADQRIKLGQQLLQAAESRIIRHQESIDQVHGEQSKLRDQVQEDVAKSLQSYDQWMGQIDESFTKAVRDLDARLGRIEHQMSDVQDDTHKMMSHAAALLEQTQQLLADAFGAEVETVMPDAPQAPIKPTPSLSAPADQSSTQAADTTEIIVDEEPPEEDIFSKVLRRLRDQQDDDQPVA